MVVKMDKKHSPDYHPLAPPFVCINELLDLKQGWRNVDPEPRVGGGVWPKAEKKIVTSRILMTKWLESARVTGSTAKHTLKIPNVRSKGPNEQSKDQMKG